MTVLKAAVLWLAMVLMSSLYGQTPAFPEFTELTSTDSTAKYQQSDLRSKIGWWGGRLQNRASFVDSIAIPMKEIEKFVYKYETRPEGKTWDYFQIIDHLFEKDTLIVISKEGNNWGYSGIRQVVFRQFTLDTSSLDYVSTIKVVLGAVDYQYYSFDVTEFGKKSFAHQYGCSPENVGKMWATDYRLKVIDGQTLEIDRPEIVRSRSEGQGNCQEIIRRQRLIDISTIADPFLPIDPYATVRFYCQCTE